MGTSSLRGPRGQRGTIAEQILVAARHGFAVDGYAGTTLQAIARAAGVDTKLVRYYFGDKAGLFDACIAFPSDVLHRLRAGVDVPLERRGRAAVRAMLAAWADPDVALVLRTSLLIAGHEPAAMDRVKAVYSDGLIPAVTAGLPESEARSRGGLIGATMIGMAFARFVFALDEASVLSDEQLIDQLGETVQRYLTGPWPVTG